MCHTQHTSVYLARNKEVVPGELSGTETCFTYPEANSQNQYKVDDQHHDVHSDQGSFAPCRG